jgi:hypothetical protein
MTLEGVICRYLDSEWALPMKNLSAAVLILLASLFFALGAAHALSCVAPTMNQSAVEGAAVIFEGVTGKGRRLSRAEAAGLDAAGLTTLGGGIADLRVFDFTVTKAWKGAADGQSVLVLRNTYWGDSFAGAWPYLVVGVQVADNLYLSPLCGNTTRLSAAADAGTLKTLERLTGERSQAP